MSKQLRHGTNVSSGLAGQSVSGGTISMKQQSVASSIKKNSSYKAPQQNLNEKSSKSIISNYYFDKGEGESVSQVSQQT